MDLECKHCHGRLGVSGGMVRCDLCGVEVPDHELMKGEAPRRQELPEPLAIESEAGAFAYELSSGRGLYGEPIFGMSIVRAYRGGRTRRCYRLSGCHRSRSAAMAVVYRMQNLYNFVRKARASNGEVAN